MNNVEIKIIMGDLYETEYQIYDHLNTRKSRPLSSVAYHESEDINKGSLLKEAFSMYISRGIKDIYGLSILEFLELPKDIVELMFLVADEEPAKKAKAIAELEKELGK